MPKCYNIIFNSRNGTVNNTITNSKADVTYSFDFNNIPDGEYKATFNFIGEQNGTTISAGGYKLAMVYMNLGQTNTYEAGNISSVNYTNSYYMGRLYPFANTSTASFLSSIPTDNPPVYIDKLSNNQINIKILSSSGGLWTDTASLVVSHYILGLHLELIKEYDISLTKSIEQKISDYEYEEVEEEVETYEIPKAFQV